MVGRLLSMSKRNQLATQEELAALPVLSGASVDKRAVISGHEVANKELRSLSG